MMTAFEKESERHLCIEMSALWLERQITYLFDDQTTETVPN
jgi:hypothetical protein